MSRFLLLTVLLSAVLPWNYAEDLKLTYQDKIVTCTITAVRVTTRNCEVNLYIDDISSRVAFNGSGITVQVEWRSIYEAKFICRAHCRNDFRSFTLGPVEFTVNKGVIIGLIVGGALFLPLTCLGLVVCRDQRRKRRDARNRVPDPPPPVSFATSTDTVRYHRNTHTLDSLRGPRHEVRTFQHTGPASYRREELRLLPTTFPVHAPAAAPREELILAPVPAPHIFPIEAPPSYEQALELEKAADF